MLMNILLVSVMLTCFAVILGYAIQSVYPLWGTNWFPVFTFLIAFITMLTRYFRRFSYETSPNPIGIALVEAILIILIAKLVSIFSTVSLSGAAIWQEVASWEQNFLEAFFTIDHILRAFSLLLVWVMGWAFSAPLNQLEEDEALMQQEKLGYTFTDRYVARRQLIGLIFNMGIVMIIMLVIMNSNITITTAEPIPGTRSVRTLIIYFFTAFLFLAFNQYAIMKARWYFNDIKVSPDLAKRWISFSLFFIFLVIILIVFLPTGFTFNAGELARWISEVFISVATFLFSLIMAPFSLIVMLLERLMSDVSVEEPFLLSTPERPELFPQIVNTMPWWDVVRSLIFWLVFFVVIIYALVYYFMNKPNLSALYQNLRVIIWLKSAWSWLVQAVSKAQQATVDGLKTGWEKINTFIQNQQIKVPALMAITQRLQPRQAIILIYIDWIRWNTKQGLVRKIAQTPLEYAQVYHQKLPDGHNLHEPVMKLTDLFIQARYSRQPLIKAQVQEAQQLTQYLKTRFTEQKKMQESHA